MRGREALRPQATRLELDAVRIGEVALARATPRDFVEFPREAHLMEPDMTQCAVTAA